MDKQVLPKLLPQSVYETMKKDVASRSFGEQRGNFYRLDYIAISRSHSLGGSFGWDFVIVSEQHSFRHNGHIIRFSILSWVGVVNGGGCVWGR